MEGAVNEMDHMGEGAGEEASSRATPVMAQFLVLKQANPGSLLFFRMGDFYELFFEDAEIASRTLGIVLTKRGKHQGLDIPMCGVPVHAADDYLQKLIGLGHDARIMAPRFVTPYHKSGKNDGRPELAKAASGADAPGIACSGSSSTTAISWRCAPRAAFRTSTVSQVPPDMQLSPWSSRMIGLPV